MLYYMVAYVNTCTPLSIFKVCVCDVGQYQSFLVTRFVVYEVRPENDRCRGI